MRVLIVGASGFIGRNVARALAERGDAVAPVSRRDGVDVRRLTRAADWAPHVVGIDAVVNAVGIIGETAGQDFVTLHTTVPCALFDACAARGIRRVVQVSALGADDTAFSAYHQSKRAADRHLLGLGSGVVLRPALIYGRGGGSAEFFLRVARWPRLPVLGDGGQALQPIHIADVVAAVLAALDGRGAGRAVDLVGLDSVGFGDWLQAMRRAQGLPPARWIHVPYWLALSAAALGRRLSPLLRTDNVRMLRRGYRASGEAVAELLGRPPTAFSPELFFTDRLPAAAKEAT